ncbi:DUF6978 family protein [Bifidobacterium felsineum]|uniref:Uncharacterized protein n=1 Tax=Bifidobacterium felsineum TaxID=2045440 RepID=A0A2M9HJ33_9BIFI|nr:hypothetical protein [Bifidobacterium felsineum]PJM76797.1 hypothetical protein CSQ86_06740 [Bifidobacterium felsineum]
MAQQWTLSQADAERLIDEIKKTFEREFTMPAPGEHNREFRVKGVGGTEYTIAPYQGKRDPSKHSVSARTSRNNIQLMRLCVNGAPHTNPDGTVTSGTHLHVYREGYDARTADPVDIESPDFVEDTILLLKKFNVIEIPSFQDGIKVGI